MTDIKTASKRTLRTTIAALLPLIGGTAGCPTNFSDCDSPKTVTLNSITKPVSLDVKGMCIQVGGELTFESADKAKALPIVIGCNDQNVLILTPDAVMRINITGKESTYKDLFFDLGKDGKVAVTQTDCTYNDYPGSSKAFVFSEVTDRTIGFNE